MRRKLVLTVLMATMLMAAPALAANINVINYESAYNVGVSFYGHEKTAYTGQFNTVLGDGSSAIGYCVDLPQNAYMGNADYNMVGAANFNQREQEAGWLMHNFAPDLDNEIIKGYDRKTTLSALQLAIWEVIYDESHSLKNGNFSLTWVNRNVAKLATRFLNSIPDSITLASIDYSAIGKHSKYQDLLVGKKRTIPGGGTPEPGTALLFASSMGAFAWYRRRKVKKMKG